MIVYDLACESGHTFEGWFNNAEDFSTQQSTGLLTCPLCGSEQIHKRPSPSRLNLNSAREHISELTAIRDDADRLLQKLHNYVEKHFDDVGDKFVEEARKIHYGDAEERNIRGLATLHDVVELHEEGIETIALPVKAVDKDKLN